MLIYVYVCLQQPSGNMDDSGFFSIQVSFEANMSLLSGHRHESFPQQPILSLILSMLCDVILTGYQQRSGSVGPGAHPLQ